MTESNRVRNGRMRGSLRVTNEARTTRENERRQNLREMEKGVDQRRG